MLEELAQQFELPRLIIEYRELDKLKSVYTDALPHQIATDGRIHCQLNQTVAATGRLSSSDPNLQNIPIRSEMGRRIRRAFVAEEGNKIISADYSQLELRLLAHITQDPVMLEAFQKGEDIHARTARCVRREDRCGAERSATVCEDRELRDRLRDRAVGIIAARRHFAAGSEESHRGLLQHVQRRAPLYGGSAGARQHGYVRSIYGRIRPLPGIADRNANIRKAAEREAINMPIQGRRVTS